MAAHPTTLPDLLQASDERLAAQAHDSTSAFAELYHRHFARVYRYHLARTGNVPDAQDLTTQTFLAAMEGVARFRGAGSFIAWLMGIARNLTAQHYRSHRPTLDLEAAKELVDPAPWLETQVSHRLQLAEVSRVLQQLTDEQAAVITLCIFGEISAQEAGQVMGKSEAAVKMLLLRGLKELRRQIKNVTEEQ